MTCDRNAPLGPYECPNCPGMKHWPHECPNAPINWEKRYTLLLGVLTELQAAAQKVIDETHRIHDNSPWPQKYRAPYGAIVELGQVLAKQYGLSR